MREFLIFFLIFMLFNILLNKQNTNTTTLSSPIYVIKTPKEYYIFGTESSGTRFLSRNVAKIIDSNVKWDGEMPACRKIGNNGDKVVHVSVPWGGTCNGHIDIQQNFDICERSVRGRKFANITNTILTSENRKAIIVIREKEFVIRSIRKHHCFMSKEIAEREYKTSINLIQEAVNNLPANRILVVKYENLGKRDVWGKISDFVGERNELVPVFKNGNNL